MMRINILNVWFLLQLLDKCSQSEGAAREEDKQYSKSSVNNISLACTLSAHESKAWVRLHLSSECTLDRQRVPV